LPIAITKSPTRTADESASFAVANPDALIFKTARSVFASVPVNAAV
jgi:hypothetical protein